MSLVITSPFSKPSCGNAGFGTLKDSLGNTTNLQVVGTDPDVGVVDGSVIATYYAPDEENTNNGTFMICIESAGVFYVNLEDGSDFVITTVQSTAYLGTWYPAKLLRVNVGTTGDFSVGY
jgi:hypothetical protein